MSVGLLFECDDAVFHWLTIGSGWPKFKYDRAVGLLDGAGELIGAVVFSNWNGHNVEMTYCGQSTLTPGVVRCLARFILTTFDPSRLTVITSKRNRRLMRSLQKIGFRLEGIQRRHFGTKDCNRNTGVRFVAFREAIERIARIPEEQRQCL